MCSSPRLAQLAEKQDLQLHVGLLKELLRCHLTCGYVWGVDRPQQDAGSTAVLPDSAPVGSISSQLY